MEDMGPGEVRGRKGGECDQNALYNILKELTKSCFFNKRISQGHRDYSLAKGTSRGCTLDSQHPHCGSQLPVSPGPETVTRFWPLHAPGTQMMHR